MASPTSLATIVDQLYALTPEEFTPTRNALSRETKAADAELARTIVLLRKPTPAAWLANMLVRHRAESVEAALALGQSLRDAQDELDRQELQRLTKQRRQLVSALARDGAALATELGHPVSAGVIEEVAQTLQAAMTDAAASAALRSGRLLRPLTASGFDPVDLTDAVAAPDGMAPPPARRASSSRNAAASRDPAAVAEARAAADRDAARSRSIADADGAVDAAETALDDIDKRIGTTDRRRDALELDLARAETAVRDLRADIAAVDREGRTLSRDRDRAVHTAEAANDEARWLRDG